jgi:hypothetical protein
MPFNLANDDSTRAPHKIDTRWRTKALLRFIGSIFAVIAMGIFSAAVSQTNNNFINTAGNGDWPDGMTLAPVMSIHSPDIFTF